MVSGHRHAGLAGEDSVRSGAIKRHAADRLDDARKCWQAMKRIERRDITMFNEFKNFVARGNVLDLAVGVIIGGAFGKIVTSLTDDILMPVIGLATGGADFTNKYVVLSGDVPAGATLEAAKQAGAVVMSYGSFVNAVINFLILAFVIFLIVRQANRMNPPAQAAPAGPSEVELLAEIRDALKK
jgi:large conductance mechanosensitive channel